MLVLLLSLLLVVAGASTVLIVCSAFLWIPDPLSLRW